LADTIYFNITVLESNRDPIANNDTIFVDEDTLSTIYVLGNDSDPDDDNLVLLEVFPASNGNITVNYQEPFVTYAPDKNYFGTDSFAYVVHDGKSAFDSASVAITVVPLPDYPIARDDSITIDEDFTVIIDILDNDSDPDGDEISYNGHTSPLYGDIVNVIGDTALVYKPIENYFGVDTFLYSIEDGSGLQDTAMVVVNIQSQNDIPSITLPDSIWIFTNNCDSISLWDLSADKETPDSLLNFYFKLSPDTLPLVYNSYTGFMKICATNLREYYQYMLSITVIDLDLGKTIDTMFIVIPEIDEIENEISADIPAEFRLQQNYPNPFNPLTHINYWLPQTSHVIIEIYDIVGQKIESLVDQSMEAGKHQR
jgi:hypothetical protein